MEIAETKSINLYTSKSDVKEAASVSRSEKTSSSKTEDNATAVKQDTFTKEKELQKSETGIYSKEDIRKAAEEMEDQRTQAFISMIQKMFEAQGSSYTITIDDINKNIKENFSDEDIEEAKEAVSDDGEFSVDAVSTRIMDLAQALAGDDPSKISVLRDAVTKGFGMAAKQLGLKDDDMPEITKKTFSEVMDRFDKWEDSYKTAEETSVE